MSPARASSCTRNRAPDIKAFTFTRYGGPEVLEKQELPVPAPAADEVLIETQAVSINGSDWEILRARPAYSRLFGLFRPSVNVLGSDIAGRVAAVGRDVDGFQPGDSVYGDLFGSFGGFAEYVCGKADKLLHKPAALTFDEAATLPQGGVIALQGLRDLGQVQAGQSVLINGAGGSSGCFAVQLAKLYGANVTAVDNGHKVDFLRSLGADEVIDYTREDFASHESRYDLILDYVAYRSLFIHKRILKPGGRYLLVGGSMLRLLQALTAGPLVGLLSDKRMGILGHHQNTTDIAHVAELCIQGKIKPIIAQRYPLGELRDALRFAGEGRACGKVVISF